MAAVIRSLARVPLRTQQHWPMSGRVALGLVQPGETNRGMLTIPFLPIHQGAMRTYLRRLHSSSADGTCPLAIRLDKANYSCATTTACALTQTNAQMSRYQSLEILNFFNRILGQRQLKPRLQTHPTMSGLAQGYAVVVEAGEAINVDVCLQIGLHNCRSHPMVASRPATEAPRGMRDYSITALNMLTTQVCLSNLPVDCRLSVLKSLLRTTSNHLGNNQKMLNGRRIRMPTHDL
jgi:hypothetical protein